jgi:hypothetical protein
MSTTLGTLLLVLQAETSAFAKGMGDAKKLAFDTSGDIVASLGSIGTQLDKLKFGNEAQFKRSAEIMGASLAGIAVAATATAIAFAKSTADQAFQLNKLSQTYGISIEALTGLRVASKMTGVPMESLARSLGFLDKAAVSAVSGNKQTTLAFKQLGISVKDLQDGKGGMKDQLPLLLLVADHFSKLKGAVLKVSEAKALMGRGGPEEIALLNQGAAAIQGYIDKAKEMGLVMTVDDVAAALRFHETLELVDMKVDAIKQHIGIGLIGPLNYLAEAFDGAGNAGRGWNAVGETIGNGLIRLSAGFRSLGYDVEFAAIWLNHYSSLDEKLQQTAALHERVAAAGRKMNEALTGSTQHGAGGSWGDTKGNNPPVIPSGAGHAKETTGEKVGDALARINDETKAQQGLLSVIGLMPEATLRQTAANEANKEIETLSIQAHKAHQAALTALQKQEIQEAELKKVMATATTDYAKSVEAATEKAKLHTFEQQNLAKAGGLSGAALRAAQVANELLALGFGKAKEITGQFAAQLRELASALTAAKVAELVTSTGDATAKLQLDSQALREHNALVLQSEDLQEKKARQKKLDVIQDQINNETDPKAIAGLRQQYAGQVAVNQGESAQAALDKVRTDTSGVRMLVEAERDLGKALADGSIDRATYNQGMANAKQKISELYDPMAKLLKEQQDLNLAYSQGAISVALYAQRMAELKAQTAMAQLETAPKSGPGGIGQGINAGAQSVATEWKSLPAETGQATIQTLHTMQGAFSNFFSQVAMGTKSIGKAFLQLGTEMLGAIVNSLAQMLAKWITHQMAMLLVKTSTDQAMIATEATTASQTNAIHGMACLKRIGHSAAEAAAHAFKWVMSEVPFPVNIVLAPLVAAGAFAGVMAFGALASAAGGMEVDRDQMAFLHKDEKVLPARLSKGFDSIINSFRVPQAGAGHLAFAGAGGGSNYSSSVSGDNHFAFHNYGQSDPQATSDQNMARVKRFFRTGGVRK